ncbi:MAG: ABC transporter ATP-binding protein, partial [Chloroflexi bacterium]|nr:ABC transporter ATP-binding protein [Chloroflexota bacterium]
MSALLQVTDLRTLFHTDMGTVRAVDGVSFFLNEGEKLGIVGESGCGKSVSMLSIMKLIPQPPGEIASGSAVFEGRDLLRLDESEMDRVRAKEIAMVFQDPMTSLNPVLTIGRQLTEAAEIHLGMSPEQARRHAIDLLRLVNVPAADQRLNEYPHQFSGGMRQRVMIAMAISCHPKVLIADEPTTALDVTIQAQIIELVKRLGEELGMAVIWITHDLGVVAGLCDRVQVMYAGRIVESASVDELYEHPAHPYTLGLMGSLPRLDGQPKARLLTIPGLPPDLIHMPEGCAFSPRCPFVHERCEQERPSLERVAEGHVAACWLSIEEIE